MQSAGRGVRRRLRPEEVVQLVRAARVPGEGLERGLARGLPRLASEGLSQLSKKTGNLPVVVFLARAARL